MTSQINDTFKSSTWWLNKFNGDIYRSVIKGLLIGTGTTQQCTGEIHRSVGEDLQQLQACSSLDQLYVAWLADESTLNKSPHYYRILRCVDE